ncbi:MAG: SPOR domain-containing protein [Mariprofundus sp.]
MPEPSHWHASGQEQRVAWIVTACCVITILAASYYPQWFDFSSAVNNQQEKPASTLHQTGTTPQKTAAVEPVHRKSVVVTDRPVLHNNSKTATASTTVRPAAGYYIQFGAFRELARANKLADRLRHLGWKPQIVIRNKLHIVWVGPESSQAKAERLHATISKKMSNRGFIVHK